MSAAPERIPLLRLHWCDHDAAVHDGDRAALPDLLPGIADSGYADAMLRRVLAHPPPTRLEQGRVDVRLREGAAPEPVDTLRYRPLQRWRHRCGYVHRQDALLENRSIRDNVGLPLMVFGRRDLDPATENDPTDPVAHLLERLGVAHRLHHMPGACTPDEAHRIRLARALITRPELLLIEGAVPEDWHQERLLGDVRTVLTSA